MKKKGSKKTNILVYVIIVLVVIFAILFFLNNGKKVMLSCTGVESDENAEISTNFLINKAGKNLHVNYTGEITFLNVNELAYTALSMYAENQVSKFKEEGDTIANFEKTENQITYSFDFNMDSVSEDKVKGLLGIYSKDIKKLKKHFENGGLTCEEK